MKTDNSNFKNIKTAYKRAKNIIKKKKWWDKYVPEWLYLKLANKFPWTHNYEWLMQPTDDEDYFSDLCVQDMWAGAINRWCDNNKSDCAPYCVRRSCAKFINSLFINPEFL